MRLWILRRTDRIDYDEHDAAVIRANTEGEARKIAADKLYEHVRWAEDSAVVSCEPLTVDGEPGIILDSFNAG